jgi:uncharacterized protein YegL
VSDFNPSIKIDNRDPRVACALLLDTSWSMDGPKIDQLNEGFEAFCDSIQDDPLARKRTEVLVVTFGGTAQVAVHFQEGRDLTPITFVPQGGTPMGAAIDLALDELTARKQLYKDNGLEYYRPWLFVITDGAPTDGVTFEHALERLHSVEAKKGVTVFGVGVDTADMAVLGRLSKVRQAVQLNGLAFVELFQWLSASMSVVSQSTPGTTDAEIAENQAEDDLALPAPAGWAKW